MTAFLEAIGREMQSPYWADEWARIGIDLVYFTDVGLRPDASDLESWQRCQAEQLILITDNRNHDSDDSLEATIQSLNTPESLPVFTIGDLSRFRKSREYAEKVVEQIFDHLLNIDRVRGAGRLYLP